MSVKVDIKYNNTLIDTISQTGTIEYATAHKYLEHPLSIDFTGTEDATAIANKILSGYSGYIADGSKAIGTVQTYNGEYHIPVSPVLCFTANTAGSTISMRSYGSPARTHTFATSSNGFTSWKNFIPGTTIITLANIGDKVYFKGDNPGGTGEYYETYLQFVMTGSIAASGNVMSLIDDGACEAKSITSNYGLGYLFKDCTSLTTPPELPATTISVSCYAFMFSGCTNLISAPQLPALYATDGCYHAMFEGCSSLTTPPALPATTLTMGCYRYMFIDCTALTSVPNLPAASVRGDSYGDMFHGCTALYVSDTQGSEYPYQWKIPQKVAGTAGNTQWDMFTGCLGTRSTNSPKFYEEQKIYYTQNPPV